MPDSNPQGRQRRWPSLVLDALQRLPLPLLYGVADLLFLILYHLARFQRDVVRDNLAQCFPGMPAAQRRRLAAAAYRNALHVLFETVYAGRMPRDELARRVDIENPQLLDTLRQRHGTVLAVAAHHGNWEWLQLACSATLDARLAALYKPLDDAAIDRRLLRMRGRFGAHLLEARSALPELLAFAREPGVIAMVADQGPQPGEDSYWCEFLGRETAFYPGVEKLARLFRAPLVFIHMQRLARGRYRVRFETLAEPPHAQQPGELMQRYVRAVERQVRDAPQDWLWVYKRWKYPRSVYGG